MKYDFDEVISRRNSNSEKWDRVNDKEILPMWVADMDFKTAPPILDAIKNKAEKGVFGYTLLPNEYYNAVIHWWKSRYDFEIQKDWILYCTGVVPAITCLIKNFTTPGDKVLIQAPVYNCFYSSILNNGCKVISNDLKYNGIGYEIDFNDLERKASDPDVKLMLLCNPHNPVGKVWTKAELLKIGEICIRNGVLIITDEIHCDIVYKEYSYTPFSSISDTFLMNSITCTSPSKTFNLAGLHTANLIVANKDLRDKVNRALNVSEIAEPNAFSVEALVAAYNCCDEWLEQLLQYLDGNIKFLKGYIEKEMPKLEVVQPEATYLVWINCKKTDLNSNALKEKLLMDGKLLINEGRMYGENGEGFVRINVACPMYLLIEGLNRFKKVISKI